ncbi:hypothetical protein CJU90_6755 [Yarrowia sp. C11]|nr:hypothetical protein CJU90_6755 [Yarrowia sp. C11]KAG5359419.1 hypothetical protein CKK34_5770 [Yarrowia sp. E02]
MEKDEGTGTLRGATVKTVVTASIPSEDSSKTLITEPLRAKRSFKQWLYLLSHVLLIVFIIGFMVVSPIDIITQSRQTNQFWNGAIVIAGCVIFIFLALLLSFLRLFRTRQNLADIPRRYVPRPDDVPKNIAKEIRNELDRCKQILRVTRPKEKVAHDGLAPPDSSGDIPPDVPYKDVVDTTALLVDSRARNIHFSFGKPIGMPFREYISHLISCHVISDAKVGIQFVELYERLRFSGKPITAPEIRTFIERLMRLMENIDFPPEDVLYKNTTANPSSVAGTQFTSQNHLLPPPAIGSKSNASVGPNFLSDDLAVLTTWSSNVNSESPVHRGSNARSDAEYVLQQQNSHVRAGSMNQAAPPVPNHPYHFFTGGDHPQNDTGLFEHPLSRNSTRGSRISRFSPVGSVIGPDDYYDPSPRVAPTHSSSDESYAGSVIIRREES